VTLPTSAPNIADAWFVVIPPARATTRCGESAGAAAACCGTRVVIGGLVWVGSSFVSASRHRALLAGAPCATGCRGAEAGESESEED